MTVATFDETAARQGLRAACQAVGLTSDGARLIRLGDNAVFRLTEPAVVARVARDLDRLPSAERQLAVARWLSSAGIPAIRPWPSEQPVVADGRVVLFWESVSDEESYGTPAELGGILRRLHGLDLPSNVVLPEHDPFGRAHRRLTTVDTLSAVDRAFLLDRWKNLRAAYDEVSFSLSRGPIHDDANVGNLIKGRDGRGVLSDLDGFCIGPREWDLIQTAIFYDRFGWHTEDEYAAFVAAYGYNLLAWPDYPMLADARELLMVSWLSQNAFPGTESAAELAHRLHTLRTGGSRQRWRAL